MSATTAAVILYLIMLDTWQHSSSSAMYLTLEVGSEWKALSRTTQHSTFIVILQYICCHESIQQLMVLEWSLKGVYKLDEPLR